MKSYQTTHSNSSPKHSSPFHFLQISQAFSLLQRDGEQRQYGGNPNIMSEVHKIGKGSIRFNHICFTFVNLTPMTSIYDDSTHQLIPSLLYREN